MELTFRNILLNEDNWQANISDKDLPLWMKDTDDKEHEGEDVIYNVINVDENDLVDRFMHKENAEECLANLKKEDPETYKDYTVQEEWVTDKEWHWMDEQGWLKDSLHID